MRADVTTRAISRLPHCLGPDDGIDTPISGRSAVSFSAPRSVLRAVEVGDPVTVGFDGRVLDDP